MSGPAVSLASPQRLPFHLDHDAWVTFLRTSLPPDGQWRPAEFGPTSWLFTGNPDSDLTTSCRCRVRACTTVVSSRCLCNSCGRALTASGVAAGCAGDEDEFVARYQPALAHRSLTGAACVVSRDGERCQRRRENNQSGLCHAHTGRWNRVGRELGVTREDWAAGLARPLPARPACRMPGCSGDASADITADRKTNAGLCGTHLRVWRISQVGLAGGQREDAVTWAARQPLRLRVNQFSLAPLAPTVRWELLHALVARDRQGQRLDPTAVHGLVRAFTGLDALATTTDAERRLRIGKTGNVRAYGRLTWRIVDLAFEQFRGVSHTDKDIWQCLSLDLAAPRPGRRPNLSVLDFTPISQPWLREAMKAWVATAQPNTSRVGRGLQAVTLASRALSLRPGGGLLPGTLAFAEVTAVYLAIKGATRADGQLYDSHFRRGLWAGLWAVIDLGRASGLLDDLPGSFARNSSQRIIDEQPNEDSLGKAIPETVIAQLDAHLHLLEAGQTYGRRWSHADTAAMFSAAYQVLRDTGRRPGEVVSLSLDCLEFDDGQPALIYDNHKSNRLRRRLPITTDTAQAITDWQQHRAGLQLPTDGRRWLFPACNDSSGAGHLTTIRLGTALRRWTASIPVLLGDLPGPDGSPLPFDRSGIYAYAFRHSYAQRHADAGVGVDILQELMDHKDMGVTQGYYTVSLKRKRQAISIMSRYVHDRTGAPRPAPGSESAGRYELTSVAVPFGNCIEPSNVKAGGKQCPIRFQCAGCGFYRPDPSYLPAIEDHINALKADTETARALDVDDFVLRNLTDQADAFSHVATAMRDRLHDLDDNDRAEIERASAVLRKMRGGGRHQLLPLTVISRP